MDAKRRLEFMREKLINQKKKKIMSSQKINTLVKGILQAIIFLTFLALWIVISIDQRQIGSSYYMLHNTQRTFLPASVATDSFRTSEILDKIKENVAPRLFSDEATSFRTNFHDLTAILKYVRLQ